MRGFVGYGFVNGEHYGRKIGEIQSANLKVNVNRILDDEYEKHDTVWKFEDFSHTVRNEKYLRNQYNPLISNFSSCFHEIFVKKV